MENYNEQFEYLPAELSGQAGLEKKLKDRFSADLKELLEPPKPVPQSVDKKIIEMAQKKFIRKHPYKFLRWLAPVAAAAAIILAVFLNAPQQLSRESALSQKVFIKEDIDHSGRVDILDAMKLDMQIKNAAAANLDFDFNKDGLVNKKDVDIIAYAAVRINKGVI